jgi:biopolymer transport protein TolQ
MILLGGKMNYAYAAPAGANVAVNMNVLDAIMDASLIVQLTLLILVGLSVICWAVGLFKYFQIKRIQIANDPFIDKFWKATSLDALFKDLDSYHTSNIARVFEAGYKEMQKLAESAAKKGKAKGDEPVMLSGIDNLERTLRKAVDSEINYLESKLTWLATTGSTGPFIGLFGTVWGIMSSFHKIGVTGSASLAVVAPGISEALVTTAIGLAAAIPAVVMFNNFASKIRKQEVELNNFSNDFLNIVKRNFFKES